MDTLTSCKRFASGLDFAYCIRFPLGIQSVRISKQFESAAKKNPNKGRMFGWIKCFHPITSRHNPWVEVEERVCLESSEGTYLKNPVVTLPVHPEAFDGHRRPRIFPPAHVCESTVVVNPPHTYLFSKNIPSGYDTSGFADLGKQQQAPLTEFVIEG